MQFHALIEIEESSFTFHAFIDMDGWIDATLIWVGPKCNTTYKMICQNRFCVLMTRSLIGTESTCVHWRLNAKLGINWAEIVIVTTGPNYLYLVKINHSFDNFIIDFVCDVFIN